MISLTGTSDTEHIQGDLEGLRFSIGAGRGCEDRRLGRTVGMSKPASFASTMQSPRLPRGESIGP